jgi:ABC-type arginine/histidine transport system permease subunit
LQTNHQLLEFVGSSVKLNMLASACGWAHLQSVATPLLRQIELERHSHSANGVAGVASGTPLVVQLLTLSPPGQEFPLPMHDLWHPETASFSRVWLMQWLDVGFHGGYASQDFMLGMQDLLIQLLLVRPTLKYTSRQLCSS